MGLRTLDKQFSQRGKRSDREGIRDHVQDELEAQTAPKLHTPREANMGVVRYKIRTNRKKCELAFLLLVQCVSLASIGAELA